MDLYKCYFEFDGKSYEFSYNLSDRKTSAECGCAVEDMRLDTECKGAIVSLYFGETEEGGFSDIPCAVDIILNDCYIFIYDFTITKVEEGGVDV